MRGRLIAILFVLVWIAVLGTAPAYAADITVDTLEDGIGVAGCSLREAIASANANNANGNGCANGSGADRIVLGVSGNYTLTTGTVLGVNSAITIEEAPGVMATIEAAATAGTATWRVFRVSTGNGNLTLNGLTVRHGRVTGTTDNGGCIELVNSGSTLTLNGTTVESCSAGQHGGGIYGITGTNINILQSSVIQNNTASRQGGGLYSDGAASVTLNGSTFSGNSIPGTSNSFYYGGGVRVIAATDASVINIDNMVFTGNTITSAGSGVTSGAGISLNIFGGSVTFSGLTFTNNSVSGSNNGYGGAVRLEGDREVTFSNSVFTGNTALSNDPDNNTRQGAAILFGQGAGAVINSRFESNNAGVSTWGGAIMGNSIHRTITGSCFVNNGDSAVFAGNVTARDISGGNDNWWGSIWGPQISDARGGSVVSSGDSIRGDGTAASNVDVGLTSAGTPTTAPTGDWLMTAPTVAGALCQTQALFYDTGNLTVTVPFQGRPTAPNTRLSLPVTVILKPTGTGVTSAAVNTTLTTDQNGVLTLSGIPANDYYHTGYTLWVKGAHTLAHSEVVYLLEGSNAVTLSAALPEGDANNDNVVLLVDFSILATAFGTSTGQAGYDARADFNGDGLITLPDFSMLATNFSVTGAAAP